MREWPESWKQSLRYLAAARFYLPEELKGADKYGADEHYLRLLHHREYGLALDELAEIGAENQGFAEESLFWSELALAAENMGLLERAAEFRRNAQQAEAQQRCSRR